ncbi:MAG: hypothetical protein ACK55I_04895, partial [bacterium]
GEVGEEGGRRVGGATDEDRLVGVSEQGDPMPHLGEHLLRGVLLDPLLLVRAGRTPRPRVEPRLRRPAHRRADPMHTLRLELLERHELFPLPAPDARVLAVGLYDQRVRIGRHEEIG